MEAVVNVVRAIKVKAYNVIVGPEWIARTLANFVVASALEAAEVGSGVIGVVVRCDVVAFVSVMVGVPTNMTLKLIGAFRFLGVLGTLGVKYCA